MLHHRVPAHGWPLIVHLHRVGKAAYLGGYALKAAS